MQLLPMKGLLRHRRHCNLVTCILQHTNFPINCEAGLDGEPFTGWSPMVLRGLRSGRRSATIVSRSDSGEPQTKLSDLSEGIVWMENDELMRELAGAERQVRLLVLRFVLS